MLSVLFFIPNLAHGGAARVLVNLVNHMDYSKFNITVQTMFNVGIYRDKLNKQVRYIGGFPWHFKGNTLVYKLFTPQQLYKMYIKEKYDMLVIADVCLCEYTSHGHCGLIHGTEILNDQTLDLLCKMSVSLAKAGADIIAPSDMMDGRVGAIRKSLDENGFINVPIMAYSAKYASAYYGPFRDAADSAPAFGDRKTYQMDVANGQEAMREIQADIEEGADIVMVKPGLAFLDVAKEAALTFNCPLAVYNVSGEYSMVKAAALNGWIDEKRIVMENMLAFKRAGAKIIITYHALDVAKWIKEM